LRGLKPGAYELGMGFHGTVVTSASPNPGALAAKAKLDGITVRADGQIVAGLDKVSIDASAVGLSWAEITRVLVEGGVAAAERMPGGAVRVGGIELAPAKAAARGVY